MLMTNIYAESLVGAKPGESIDTDIRIEATRDLTIGIRTDMADYLKSRGDSRSWCGINATQTSAGETRVFQGSRTAIIHERHHATLYQLQSKPEISFNESWAYAWTHWQTQDARAKRFRDLSLDVNRDLVAFMGKANLEGLQDWNEKNPFGHQGDNWSTFLEIASNIRYYAFVYDVLKRFKDNPRKQKAILYESVERCRCYNLQEGLKHLVRWVDFDPEFVSAGETYERDPITLFPLRRERGFSCQGTGRDTNISVNSADYNTYLQLELILTEWKSIIEEETGQEFRIR